MVEADVIPTRLYLCYTSQNLPSQALLMLYQSDFTYVNIVAMNLRHQNSHRLHSNIFNILCELKLVS